MGRKVIVCVMTICLLGISSVQASEGWIYNAGRIAYYSTALESETDGFYTWTGETWNGRVHGYGIQTFYSDDVVRVRYEVEKRRISRASTCPAFKFLHIGDAE